MMSEEKNDYNETIQYSVLCICICAVVIQIGSCLKQNDKQLHERKMIENSREQVLKGGE